MGLRRSNEDAPRSRFEVPESKLARPDEDLVASHSRENVSVAVEVAVAPGKARSSASFASIDGAVAGRKADWSDAAWPASEGASFADATIARIQAMTMKNLSL